MNIAGKRSYCLVVAFVVIMTLFSCRNHSDEIENALNLAGNNKKELQKVLDHYSEAESDSLKYKAACFLITNMAPYYSFDYLEVERFKPFYRIFDSISMAHKRTTSSPAWQKDITAAWEKYKQHTPTLAVVTENDVNHDLETIKASWLIEQIDLAFDAWQSNRHTKDDSFEDFCEYILPYRRQNGVLLDYKRKEIYLKLKGFAAKHMNYSVTHLCDEIMGLYNIGYSWDQCPDLPVLNLETMDVMHMGSCYQRAWYNTVVLTSLGMEAAIDFVPRWGNRSPNHSWNVVRAKGKSYPFDAYTLGTHWQNGTIYDNRHIEKRLGKWRLPKVFRYMFSNQMEGPERDGRVLKADVPSLFRNTRMMDVSEEYFETSDITVDIPEIPEDTHYAYLCVLGDNRDWIPVYWGEIKDGKATFEKMGRDIVYMTAFYKDGIVIPIKGCDPFWLKTDGKVEFLKKNKDKQTVCIRETNGDNIYMRNQENLAYLKQSVFLGKTADGTYDTLSVILDSMGIYRLKLDVSGDKKYRFIRMQLPTPVLGTCDITFYEVNGSPIKNVRAEGQFTALPDRITEDISWITDGIAATGYLGKATNEKMSYLDFDLGEEYPVGAIGYVPYVNSNMKKGNIYALYFWDRGKWNLADRQRGNDLYVVFENVPKGALYTVKSSTPHKLERIFTYEDNEVLWH